MTTIETTADRETHLHGLAERLVRSNVLCCLSGVVSTLAQGYGASKLSAVGGRGLADLCERAAELCAPVLDYEEGARQAGWEPYTDAFGVACWRERVIEATWAGSVRGLCDDNDIAPYEWEVYEHWAVTEWLAEKLEAEGERVDRDFEGLCVWARTTTGQAISADGVVRRIAEATL